MSILQPRSQIPPLTPAQAHTLIMDERLNLRDRVEYALGILTGVALPEMLAFQWLDHDSLARPLEMLTCSRTLVASTGATRPRSCPPSRGLPLHPALATLLSQWQTTGWATWVGRPPVERDLILPDASGTFESPKRRRQAFIHNQRKLGMRIHRYMALQNTFADMTRRAGATDYQIEMMMGVHHTWKNWREVPPFSELCKVVAAIRLDSE